MVPIGVRTQPNANRVDPRKFPLGQKETYVKLAALTLAFALSPLAALTPAHGQLPTPTPSQTPTQPLPQSLPQASATGAPMIARTTKAVNYRRASGSTKVDLHGTELMQGASGEAKVENKKNRMEIEVKFAGLDDSTKFGLEYLTYVFWAVSPQGRAENLGEIAANHGAAQIKAVTDMQTFAMIVTAEPYFAVTQPGNAVVLENSVPMSTGGKVENVDATYELLGRGVYSSSNTKIENAIFGIDPKTPRELFEARNSVRIARNAGADHYAASTLTKAEQQLSSAEEAYRSKRDKKTVESAARDVVETAEEARVMAVKKKAEEEAQARLAAEKKAAEDREAKARADAEAEAKRRADAEQARVQAEQAKAEAERMKKEAEQAAQAAAQAAQQAAQQKEAAEQAAAEAARQKAEADQARQTALEQQRLAEAETEKAKQAAARAENEKAQLRAQLLAQLNSILQTRDSARGLIVNMSDVLFDTASSTLKPGAREKLAKISGILLAHPGLTLQIEGHTDSVGSDEYNQQLSERRADSVRDYLAEEGVPVSAMTAKGFGKTQPVATNETGEGRQRNRRVELVVNGDAIGKTAAAGTRVSSTTPQ
ncbi:MAG TPA: OmpA family protein [Candidatus Limnocylindrales bacterium]|nr:OmpA family protein [Candidatus Limnocylindrales bacterium]